MSHRDMDTQRMDGKVVVVSGGSSGVGLASAKGLARLGARTVLVSRRADRGRDAERAVGLAVPGADVISVVADLTSPSSVAALIDTVGTRAGRLDVLVNATGSVGEQGELLAGIPRSFATNALTHFLLTRAALPLLRDAPAGRVLTVGAAPALVRRLRAPDLDGIDPGASAGTVITQSLAWKLILAARLSADDSRVSATVFHPGLVRSELLSQRSLPLRALGSLSNRFAAAFCPVVDHLASTRGAGDRPVMVDQHGAAVRVPAAITEADGVRVWSAAALLADRLGAGAGAR